MRTITHSMYGDAIGEVIEHTVVLALRVNTPNALRNAERELQGITRLLIHLHTFDHGIAHLVCTIQESLLRRANHMERA